MTFNAYKKYVNEAGGCVRTIRVPSVASQPRSFFDKLNSWAQGEGAPGLGYISFETDEGKGPIAKFVSPEAQKALRDLTGVGNGDVVFFVCDTEAKANKFAGLARDRICDDAGLREKGVALCGDRRDPCALQQFVGFRVANGNFAAPERAKIPGRRDRRSPGVEQPEVRALSESRGFNCNSERTPVACQPAQRFAECGLTAKRQSCGCRYSAAPVLRHR